MHDEAAADDGLGVVRIDLSVPRLSRQRVVRIVREGAALSRKKLGPAWDDAGEPAASYFAKRTAEPG